MSKNKSIRISSGKEIELIVTHPELDVDYPSDWFKRNPNKPTITLKTTKTEEDNLLKAIRGGIASANLTLDTTMFFLWKYFSKVKNKLDSDWKSFGQQIGKKEDEITPWDIVEVKESGTFEPSEKLVATTSSNVTDASALWPEKALVTYLLCIYRLARASNLEYCEVMRARLENQCKALGGVGMTLSGAGSTYAGWIRNRDYVKMIAAVDMYFYYFSRSPEAHFRIGTLGSRFRDCAGFISIGYAMRLLNIDSKTLMDWIFFGPMADEVKRLSAPDQETGNKYSYFPYQSDMSLVSKSAYSSNANPNLFHWIHIIGTLMGNQRSVNAQYNFDGLLSDLMVNAGIVAWAYSRGGERGKGITAAAPEGKVNPWISTSGRDPNVWFAILKQSGFELPPLVCEKFKKITSSLSGVREGTVGARTRLHWK